MSELTLSQIHAKVDAILTLTMKTRAEQKENRMLRLLIYRNAEFLRYVDNHFLQGIIAEFEPNVPDGG